MQYQSLVRKNVIRERREWKENVCDNCISEGECKDCSGTTKQIKVGPSKRKPDFETEANIFSINIWNGSKNRGSKNRELPVDNHELQVDCLETLNKLGKISKAEWQKIDRQLEQKNSPRFVSIGLLNIKIGQVEAGGCVQVMYDTNSNGFFYFEWIDSGSDGHTEVLEEFGELKTK
jgi:hypothetical protein